MESRRRRMRTSPGPTEEVSEKVVSWRRIIGAPWADEKLAVPGRYNIPSSSLSCCTVASGRTPSTGESVSTSRLTQTE